MTFGKCVWDGCTRHAEKASTNTCRTHHIVIRDARCAACDRHLTSTQELQARPLPTVCHRPRGRMRRSRGFPRCTAFVDGRRLRDSSWTRL